MRRYIRHEEAASRRLPRGLSGTVAFYLRSTLTPLFQDCVARFTLDSATEFLFGRSVDSMSAGLQYPHYSPLIDSPSFLDHPSNTYVRSFVQAQILTIERVAFGPAWPLREFWKDRVKPHRDIIDAYAEPILNAELETKKRGTQENGGRDDEAATFLSHLVQSTDGGYHLFFNSYCIDVVPRQESNPGFDFEHLDCRKRHRAFTK